MNELFRDDETAAGGTKAPASTRMARWSAKALLIAGGVLLVGGLLWYARVATLPMIVAALVSTQLLPAVDWVTGRGVPRWLAVLGAMLLVAAAVLGLTWLLTAGLFGNLNGVAAQIGLGVEELLVWLREHQGWAEQNESAIRDFLKSILPAAKEAATGAASAALGGLSLAAQLVSGVLLLFVFLLYLLTDGDAVWRWVLGRFSADRRDQVDQAGAAAWSAGTGYVRGIALVALIDSLMIALGMVVIGTPYVGTLALLSFVTLFIPILGAWVSGTVIVLVTLGAQGSTAALLMAAVILIAQQIDSMFVTPLVYKQTVNLHPIVTLTSVMLGSQLLGIPGAFLAVPMVAVGWAVYKSLEQPDPAPAPAPAPANAASAAADPT